MGKPDVSPAELLASIRSHLERPRPDTAAFLMAAYDGLRALAASAPTTDLVEGLIAIGHFYALSANPIPGLGPASDAVDAAEQVGDSQLVSGAANLAQSVLKETAVSR